jgi:hypothetical protein
LLALLFPSPYKSKQGYIGSFLLSPEREREREGRGRRSGEV